VITNKRMVLSVEGKVKVVREIENGKKRKLTFVGNWSIQFYDPNDFVKTEPKLWRR
jgi:hypothetical protein